ncbi:hypothetical protein ACFOZ1_15235 [Gracilibacillus marinus]|uniref:Uncharacterized protein n=1 Tax=Gracilibacillus marinus TaxID=630535 RepID=A0ABV8VZJ0_9BACI
MKRKLLTKILLVTDDIFLMIGMLLVSFGFFKIYEPLGYIVSGLCFIALAYFFAQRR